jgi:sphingomyelin phosphodiesterase 2
VTHIKESIKKNYPYSHHFKSGLNGSGCCIFSRHFIEDVFYHKYSLNGYPHRIFNGDWFGGKLVGLAKIQYHGLIVNVYTTHVNKLFLL